MSYIIIFLPNSDTSNLSRQLYIYYITDKFTLNGLFFFLSIAFRYFSMAFKFIRSLSILEISLLQAILYSLIWLTNEYLATLLTFVMVPIFTGITFISWLSDRVEASRVGSKYYLMMLTCIITPILVAAFFIWVYDGVMDII